MWSSVTIFLETSQVVHFMVVYLVNSVRKDLNVRVSREEGLKDGFY